MVGCFINDMMECVLQSFFLGRGTFYYAKERCDLLFLVLLITSLVQNIAWRNINIAIWNLCKNQLRCSHNFGFSLQMFGTKVYIHINICTWSTTSRIKTEIVNLKWWTVKKKFASNDFKRWPLPSFITLLRVVCVCK